MKLATFEVHSLVEYTPQNEAHYKQVAENFLRSKGVQTSEPIIGTDGKLHDTPVWVELTE